MCDTCRVWHIGCELEHGKGILSPQFGFTPQEFNAVERLLSKERLLTYVGHAGGNRNRAFRLYMHNLKLSSSLFEMIGGLEVALRNSVHLTLGHAFGSDFWYDRVPFGWLRHEAAALQRARIRFDLGRSRFYQAG